MLRVSLSRFPAIRHCTRRSEHTQTCKQTSRASYILLHYLVFAETGCVVTSSGNRNIIKYSCKQPQSAVTGKDSSITYHISHCRSLSDSSCPSSVWSRRARIAAALASVYIMSEFLLSTFTKIGRNNVFCQWSVRLMYESAIGSSTQAQPEPANLLMYR